MSTTKQAKLPGIHRYFSAKSNEAKLWKEIQRHREFYWMLLIPVAWYIVFHYVPLYGVQIAFKNFSAVKGISGSPWVGMQHINDFFSSYYCWRLIKNTVLLSLTNLIFGFPVPIVLALLINEIRSNRYKKILQNITYIPHFISVVVIAGMVVSFLSPQTGIINLVIKFFGSEPIYFMQKPEWFRTIFVVSGIWQESGWASIIYIAALTGIDPSLYEAQIWTVPPGCRKSGISPYLEYCLPLSYFSY